MRKQAILKKRIFDCFAAIFGLTLAFWLIFLAWFLASLDTRENGFFTQVRIGRFGKPFKIIKIRTMRSDVIHKTNITCASDPRITKFGAFLRRTKIDELPQLWNVLRGEMSFVGPRPDVPGYADSLNDEDRKVLLSVRPGITGPATIAFRDEELILEQQVDPEGYNDNVIYPEKVKKNIEYIQNWRFRDDLLYIWRTIFG